MPDTLYTTIVTQGGTPIRIADQRGAPYPTTGYGSLVFNNSPTLYNPVLVGVSFSSPFGFAPGSASAPSLYFIGDADTGIYQSAPGYISFTSNGTEAGQIGPSGDWTITRNLSIGGSFTGSLSGGTGLPLSTGVTGLLGVANGGTGVNAFGSVTLYTGNQTLTAAQSYGTFANTGAAGPVTLTMPTPVVGLEYTFVVTEAQNLILDVGGSVVIALGEITTTPGGQLSSNSPYSVLTLKALSTTLWVATSLLGTWTPV